KRKGFCYAGNTPREEVTNGNRRGNGDDRRGGRTPGLPRPPDPQHDVALPQGRRQLARRPQGRDRRAGGSAGADQRRPRLVLQGLVGAPGSGQPARPRPPLPVPSATSPTRKESPWSATTPMSSSTANSGKTSTPTYAKGRPSATTTSTERCCG